MKYLGEYKNLQRIINAKYAGKWKAIQDGHQFRSNSGVIINWYSATGVVIVQGKDQAASIKDITAILDSKEDDEGLKKISPKITVDQSGSVDEVADFNEHFVDTELVIALVGAVGTDLKRFVQLLSERLSLHRYEFEIIKISSDILPNFTKKPITPKDAYERIDTLMSLGNEAREKSKDNGILAMAAAAEINKRRGPLTVKRKAYIISSIKHPAEVQKLRQIYANGFFLFGVYSDEQQRFKYLTKEKGISEHDAKKLIGRDKNESIKHGQHTSDAFHLSDFFINCNGFENRLKGDLWRCVNLIFGHPYTTPLFDEMAMFMAFANSSRSADLSRQVGAIIAQNNQIISTGCNDAPRAGGGVYLPEYNEDGSEVADIENGRDYKRGVDSNVAERIKIIDELTEMIPEVNHDEMRKRLSSSRLKDLTEFGRVVHAEMDAITSCARMGISIKGATLYCTTFPCHNCAKHIIASGIKRVVYVEPYPKSKAFEFHSESISLGLGSSSSEKVAFEPFVGVGPRNFINLFSMKMGIGSNLERKHGNDGRTLEWKPETSTTRLSLIRASYVELEVQCGQTTLNAINTIKGE